MSIYNFTIHNHDELDKVAKKIISFIPDQNIFLFDGNMGSGKTTLIKRVCHFLGINDACSPTFSIVNTYLSNNDKDIFHVDCYRIEDDNEVENTGLLEILNEKSICFIEWPEKIHNFLPNKSVNIKIELSNNVRKISIKI